MEPNEFKNYINKIKQAFVCLGTSKKIYLNKKGSTQEGKRLYFNKNLKKRKNIYK